MVQHGIPNALQADTLILCLPDTQDKVDAAGDISKGKL